MMSPNNYILPLLALAAVSLSSCIEDGQAGERPEAGGRTITFTLSNSSSSQGATRAATTRATTRAIEELADNEKAINRLDIFFYSADGSECLFYPTDEQLKRSADVTDANADEKVTITIPEETFDGKLLGNDRTIFLLANSPLERAALTGKTLAELKDIALTNEGGDLFNVTDTPPVDFVMTGESSANITTETNKLGGTISLRRAAAKIVVDISGASIAGYTPVSASVRLSNYLDKTLLGTEKAVAEDSDYAHSPWVELTKNSDGGQPFTMDAADALYTYHNDWREDLGRETYVTIKFVWLNNTDNTTKTYYYRIPFSYIGASSEASAAEHEGRVRRNHVYQFMVDVSQLGGLDPEDAVDMAANFDVIDWEDQTVDVSIHRYDYLFVFNPRTQVFNSPTYEWEYRSSRDISFNHIVVRCTAFNSNGTTTPISYGKGTPQYPVDMLGTRIDEATGKTYIVLNSMVPVNYVPLEITFTVANGAAYLFTNVALNIFPPKYVTASSSYPVVANNNDTNTSVTVGGVTYWRSGAYHTHNTNDGNGSYGSNNPRGSLSSTTNPNNSQTNFTFYKITTTTLSAEDAARGWVLGDPTEEINPHPSDGTPWQTGIWRPINHIADWSASPQSPYNSTFTDAGLNNIISPEFIVASQRGITSTNLTYDQAYQRCARYREGQYPAGTWRVPTYAELAMLAQLQNDNNSAVKELFSTSTQTNGWWTARQWLSISIPNYRYVDGTANDPGVKSAQNAITEWAAVRCVHDTWRD